MQKDQILNAAFGERVKEIRLKRNISQEGLAELIDVCNGAHISNIERGLYGVSLPRLVAICKALHVSADYLLFGVSPDTVETEFHDAFGKLSPEQAAGLSDILHAYFRACGVE